MNFFTKFTDSLRNFGLHLIRLSKRLLNQAKNDLFNAKSPACLFDVETLVQSIKDTVNATPVVVTSIGKFIKQTLINQFNRTATALSTLIALLMKIWATASQAAIFGYSLLKAGVIAPNIKEQYQKKEAPAIPLLPPCKPCLKNLETIPNKVLITPPSTSAIFHYPLILKAPTWQQQILNEIRLNLIKNQRHNPTVAESQDPSPVTEAFAQSGKDNLLRHSAKPLNNQLAILTIGWQATSQVATLLHAIKASEMKSIASTLQIPRYRNMNKTQLLLSIMEAFEQAPAFS